MILNTAGSVLDVENIIETVDYFDDNGAATINLEGGWTNVDFGTAQIQASTSSFDAVDAQHIDTDDIDVQTIEVESNLVSPAGTIGNLDATTLEVYTTLDVAGETTLGANTSVDGDVSVTGNVLLQMLLLQTTSHQKDKWMLLMMQFKLMSIRTSRTAMTLMLHAARSEAAATC